MSGVKKCVIKLEALEGPEGSVCSYVFIFDVLVLVETTRSS